MDLLIKRVAASSGLTEEEVEAAVDALWRAGLPHDDEHAILKAIRRQQPCEATAVAISLAETERASASPSLYEALVVLCSWLVEAQQIGEKHSRMEELVSGGAIHGIFALILSRPQEWPREKATRAALSTLMHHLLPDSASSIMHRLEQIVDLQPFNSSAVASFLALTIREAVCGGERRLPSDPHPHPTTTDATTAAVSCGSEIPQIFAQREQLVERLLLLRSGRQAVFDGEEVLQRVWQEVSRPQPSIRDEQLQCDQLEHRLAELRAHQAGLCDELRLCEEKIDAIVRELHALRQQQQQQTMDCSLVDGLSDSPILHALRAFQKDVLTVSKKEDEGAASKEDVELAFSDYLATETVCVDFLVDRIRKTREGIARHEKELSIYQSLSMKSLVEESQSALEKMRRELSEDEQAVQEIVNFLASCLAPSPNGEPKDSVLVVVSHERGLVELSAGLVERLKHLMASLNASSSVTVPPALLRFRPHERSTSSSSSSSLLLSSGESTQTDSSPKTSPSATIIAVEGKSTAALPSRRSASKRNGQQRKAPPSRQRAAQAVDTELAIKALEKSSGWKANNAKSGAANSKVRR
eukprot:scaffold341_cov154-Ochromonas_danica.AAC.10